jgi:hypothetical protein
MFEIQFHFRISAYSYEFGHFGLQVFPFLDAKSHNFRERGIAKQGERRNKPVYTELMGIIPGQTGFSQDKPKNSGITLIISI